MSSRKNKQNKKKNNEIIGEDNNNSSNNRNNTELSSVTFKYPGRFATLTRTILLNENLTINELQRKIILSSSQQPPDAKKVFELYYMDEIYPFINKHAQETINNKKTISKSWELQTNHFKKIYIRRSEILKIKWNEIGNKNYKINKPSYHVTNHHHHSPKNNIINSSQTVIFKYYSVHSSAKTNRHIFITSPKKEELLLKIKLTINTNPPTAKEIFEQYYYDEILPFLKKSGQQSIRGKKDLSKVWQIQTKTFKGLYEDRAKILLEEWIKLKKNSKKPKKSRSASQLLDKHQYQKKIIIKKSQKNNSINSIIINSNSKQIKIECNLIRTLLNFLLFVECTTKQDCFMLLIDNQNEKYKKYNKFINYLHDSNLNLKLKLTYFHIRLFIDNFDIDSLRLHTGEFVIKLCFINPFDKNEELIIFELRWNKLINQLNQKIDHEHIEANLDDETRIISINVPIIGIS